ncbi:MAG TPA: DUF2877 domain-containing protein, partial [Ktedonobacteraceae bacterium]|nr:DUF2877 domain-containing protein [Ktedonobacteraceae bacterium]
DIVVNNLRYLRQMVQGGGKPRPYYTRAGQDDSSSCRGDPWRMSSMSSMSSPPETEPPETECPGPHVRAYEGEPLQVALSEQDRLAWGDAYASPEIVRAMAQYLCGRGIGLTPAGDDMLAGWMACNWLLHGPTTRLLEACQQILLVARQQTHLLSQCWLSYAAEGNIALPMRDLLAALTQERQELLLAATRDVLALGATSGYDFMQGILLAADPASID